MAYVPVATLSNQTLVVVPRASGQRVRFGGVTHVSEALRPLRVYGTGPVEFDTGFWDLLTIVSGLYNGPPFSGSTTGSDTHRFLWDGPEDSSTSISETRTFSGSNDALSKIQSGPWIGGQGHSGARFSGTPTYISNSPYGGGRVGFAATFVEVGDSLYA